MIKLVLILMSVLVLVSTGQSWKLTDPISNTEVAESDITPINQKLCTPCACGQTNVARITGGNNVKYVNQYPWMAQIYVFGRFHCGASLINSRYVLTATHCVNPLYRIFTTIRLLEHNQSTETESKTITRKADRIIIHRDYNLLTVANDIALIRLDEEVELGIGPQFPSPVCLPQSEAPISGMDGIVIGWGLTEDNGTLPAILQEAAVKIISNAECRSSHGSNSKWITSNNVCAGGPYGGKNVCPGDSGGPLMVTTNSKHHIVGIASWVRKHEEKVCNIEYPAVYTRVNQYLNWIRSHTKDACPCSPN